MPFTILQDKLEKIRMIHIYRPEEYMLLDEDVKHCRVFWYTIDVVIFLDITYMSRSM